MWEKRVRKQSTMHYTQNTEDGRMQVSIASGSQRCTGGVRTEVSTTSGGKRGTRSGRTQVSTMSGSKRGSSSSRMQVKTTCRDWEKRGRK